LFLRDYFLDYTSTRDDPWRSATAVTTVSCKHYLLHPEMDEKWWKSSLPVADDETLIPKKEVLLR
jgi:hypothetical protein